MFDSINIIKRIKSIVIIRVNSSGNLAIKSDVLEISLRNKKIMIFPSAFSQSANVLKHCDERHIN